MWYVQNQVKPVISLLDQLRLKDESTNQIAFILDVFSSTLQRCTGNEHLHIDLKEALELALIDHTTRILIIGGTRTCPLQPQHRCSFFIRPLTILKQARESHRSSTPWPELNSVR
jgi:hypothetical protein